jgi:hypothetical protein
MPGLLAQPSAAPAPTTPVATPATSTAPPGKGQMDPILRKFQTDVEAKVSPDLKQGVKQIVAAGMKILYSPGTHPMVQQVYDKLAADKFQPQAIATGMVNLIGMVQQSSKGQMQVEAAYPAAVVVLCYVLDDLKTMKGMTITEPVVKQTAVIMARLFLKAFGMDQDEPSATPESPSPSTQPMQPPAPAGA